VTTTSTCRPSSSRRLLPSIVFTDRSHGDLAIGSEGLDHRRHTLAPAPWTWLRQVHGGRVVVVDGPGAHAGVDADAAVTATLGCVLAVQVADCAPVALVGDGVVGVAHAGWRGLAAGVLPAAVAAMRDLGGGDVRATIGPCIHAECYAFGPRELDELAAMLGDGVRATTSAGMPALDIVAAARASLAQGGVVDVGVIDVCTACSPDHWSHRASGDSARQAVVAWM
jgi:YfiH family protein